jgi:hypothetical protein
MRGIPGVRKWASEKAQPAAPVARKKTRPQPLVGGPAVLRRIYY